MLVSELAEVLERRIARLGPSPSGAQVVAISFKLADLTPDGYEAPGSDENVVRVEGGSRPSFCWLSLTHQMTMLDADEDVAARTNFHLELTFDRPRDQPLPRFSINFGDDDQEWDLAHAEVADRLNADPVVAQVLRAAPLEARIFLDGDVDDDRREYMRIVNFTN